MFVSPESLKTHDLLNLAAIHFVITAGPLGSEDRSESMNRSKTPITPAFKQSGFDFSALQHAVEVALDEERLACVAIAWVAGM